MDVQAQLKTSEDFMQLEMLSFVWPVKQRRGVTLGASADAREYTYRAQQFSRGPNFYSTSISKDFFLF